jgi:predicted metal-binding protein
VHRLFRRIWQSPDWTQRRNHGLYERARQTHQLAVAAYLFTGVDPDTPKTSAFAKLYAASPDGQITRQQALRICLVGRIPA